ASSLAAALPSSACTSTRRPGATRSAADGLARVYRYCRLNSTLWERCLAMAFILGKPSSPCQITNLDLSGPRGALQHRRHPLSLGGSTRRALRRDRSRVRPAQG